MKELYLKIAALNIKENRTLEEECELNKLYRRQVGEWFVEEQDKNKMLQKQIEVLKEVIVLLKNGG